MTHQLGWIAPCHCLKVRAYREGWELISSDPGAHVHWPCSVTFEIAP